MENKKVIILGASPNSSRYSYRATERLIDGGFIPIPVGVKKGEIGGILIQEHWPEEQDIYAITLYLNAKNQKEHYHRILALKNSRVIFNPGAENPELMKMCTEIKLIPSEACSLVLLSLGTF